jgi:hypothetical protein
LLLYYNFKGWVFTILLFVGVCANKILSIVHNYFHPNFRCLLKNGLAVSLPPPHVTKVHARTLAPIHQHHMIQTILRSRKFYSRVVYPISPAIHLAPHISPWSDSGQKTRKVKATTDIYLRSSILKMIFENSRQLIIK